MRHFCIQTYLAGLYSIDKGDGAYPVGKPLRLVLPGKVHAPEDIVQCLVAHAHLGGQRLFAQVLERTADGQVPVHLVVGIKAYEGLALHTEGLVALHRGIDGCAGIYDALVDDGDTAVVVVNDVVRILHQCDTACGHYHRTWSNAARTEVYLVGSRTLVLAGKQELVLLCHLLGSGLGGVVQFLEHVLVGHLPAAACLYPLAQMLAEGFCHGEDDAPLIDGISVDKVKLSVGLWLVVGIQSVQVHGAEQDGALQCLLGQVVEVHAARVRLVLDVQTELLLLQRACSQRIDVAHHQFPCGQRGTAGAAFQHLQQESLFGAGEIAGELAHLIGLCTIGVFVGHSQNVVWLQGSVQCQRTQFGVQMILAGGEQFG